MPTKRKDRTELLTTAQRSALMRRVSARSPWRRTAISQRSQACLDYFQELADAGDTRRVPRPELD